jgi:hypothetical protein
MTGFKTALLLAALLIVHAQGLVRASDEWKSLPSDSHSGVVIPSLVLKMSSLEFKGLVSDLLFIQALMFEGGTYMRKEEPRMRPEEWKWLNKVLTASTDLDPYFLDPYLLANSHMTWEGGMIRETNILLEKGMRFRDRDWLLPFFAGFNSFFFLNDNARAAEFLVAASERPGPSKQLLSLASRLSYRGKRTENALLFLETVLNKTDDERQKKEYATRIRALKARLILEKSVSAYKKKFGRAPIALQRMVERGILKETPKDPYGGNFRIGPDGEIICTSDYLLMPQQR